MGHTSRSSIRTSLILYYIHLSYPLLQPNITALFIRNPTCYYITLSDLEISPTSEHIPAGHYAVASLNDFTIWMNGIAWSLRFDGKKG